MREELIQMIDTNITDAWGVVWNEMETVRDFLQNFYDANDVADISIKIQGSEVRVSAPSTFDYQELIYFGSDKSHDTEKIGQYGEGWKASVVNALRNFGCRIHIVIGDKKLEFLFKEKLIGKTIKRVVFCKVTTCDPFEGSLLVISNCTAKLIEQFKFGMGFFYYAENPFFGKKLYSTQLGSIEIYESNQDKGYVFYKKLMRATVDLPLVIVNNLSIRKVDTRIQHDRDRKAFNDEVLTKMLEGTFEKIDNQALEPVLLFLKDFWKLGHKIISTMSKTRKYYDKYPIQFPEEYYAKEQLHWSQSLEVNFEIKKLLAEYTQLGYVCCPRYMSSFGMKTPDGVINQRLLERNEKIAKIYSRCLTINEKSGIDLLGEFIGRLSPELQNKFQKAQYTIGDSDEIIGELKKKRNYREEHIFLNKVFFQFDFANAISILIHEWANIYGNDGSRTFSDALTGFIALILNNEELLNDIRHYQIRWQKLCKKVQDERSKNASHFYDLIDTLQLNQLISILKNVPEDELFLLLERAKII